MLASIGVISGLRDTYSLIGVFVLCFSTMLFGILTEQLSRPESPEKWKGDPDPVEWENFNISAFAAKFKSYAWRMTPHFMGWFPYLAAWYIVLNNFWRQIDDLPKDIQDRIPPFVAPAIYGTLAIFSTFAFVQVRYQWTKPENYWRTEIVYAFLSATAKLYLGGLLYFNVLTAASASEALAPQVDAPN